MLHRCRELLHEPRRNEICSLIRPMPAKLSLAAPNGVLPFFLCAAFVGTREYAQLQNQYHDGTIQRSQLALTSRRVYRPTMRMTATALAALYSFQISSKFPRFS